MSRCPYRSDSRLIAPRTGFYFVNGCDGSRSTHNYVRNNIHYPSSAPQKMRVLNAVVVADTSHLFSGNPLSHTDGNSLSAKFSLYCAVLFTLRFGERHAVSLVVVVPSFARIGWVKVSGLMVRVAIIYLILSV
jgi:hypothetical protein